MLRLELLKVRKGCIHVCLDTAGYRLTFRCLLCHAAIQLCDHFTSAQVLLQLQPPTLLKALWYIPKQGMQRNHQKRISKVSGEVAFCVAPLTSNQHVIDLHKSNTVSEATCSNKPSKNVQSNPMKCMISDHPWASLFPYVGISWNFITIQLKAKPWYNMVKLYVFWWYFVSFCIRPSWSRNLVSMLLFFLSCAGR